MAHKLVILIWFASSLIVFGGVAGNWPTNTILIETWEGGFQSIHKAYGKTVSGGVDSYELSYGTNRTGGLATADALVEVSTNEAASGIYSLRTKQNPTGTAGNKAYVRVGVGASYVGQTGTNDVGQGFGTNNSGAGGVWLSPESWVRFRFLLGSSNSFGADDQATRIAQIEDSGENDSCFFLTLVKRAGNLILNDKTLGDIASPALTTGQWYSVIVHLAQTNDWNFNVDWTLDGVPKATNLNVSFNRTPSLLALGSCLGTTATNHCVDIYWDDILFSRTAITYTNAEACLFCPNPSSRSGVRPLLTYFGSTAGTGWKLTMTNSAGTVNSAVYGAPISRKAVRVPVDYSLMVTGTYTLILSVTNSSGEIAQDWIRWNRASADSSLLRIGTNDQFLLNGQPLFQVGEFGMELDDANRGKLQWKQSGYLNFWTGIGYNNGAPETALTYFTNTILASASTNEVKVTGPTAGWGSALVSSGTMMESNFLAWGMWASNLFLHGSTNLVQWYSFDEPEGRSEEPYNTFQMWRWADAVWNVDPKQRPLNINLMPNVVMSRLQSQSQWANNQMEFFPWQIADSYGTDIYPIISDNRAVYGRYDALATIYEGVLNLRAYNLDLIPSIIYIETCEPSDGAYPRIASDWPTGDQVKCMAWLAVVAGAKGIGWYPWQTVTSNDVRIAMSNFVYATTQWTPVICAAEQTATVTYTSRSTDLGPILTVDQEGPIYATGRYLNGTNWIIAVNAHSNSVSGAVNGRQITLNGYDYTVADSNSLVGVVHNIGTLRVNNLKNL